jgi:hypothetical protein
VYLDRSPFRQPYDTQAKAKKSQKALIPRPNRCSEPVWMRFSFVFLASFTIMHEGAAFLSEVSPGLAHEVLQLRHPTLSRLRQRLLRAAVMCTQQLCYVRYCRHLLQCPVLEAAVVFRNMPRLQARHCA